MYGPFIFNHLHPTDRPSPSQWVSSTITLTYSLPSRFMKLHTGLRVYLSPRNDRKCHQEQGPRSLLPQHRHPSAERGPGTQALSRAGCMNNEQGKGKHAGSKKLECEEDWSNIRTMRVEGRGGGCPEGPVSRPVREQQLCGQRGGQRGHWRRSKSLAHHSRTTSPWLCTHWPSLISEAHPHCGQHPENLCCAVDLFSVTRGLSLQQCGSAVHLLALGAPASL